LTALICQITERSEPECNDLVEQRIELAERRNMKESAAKQLNVTLERALRGNQLADVMGSFAIFDGPTVDPLTDRIKDVKLTRRLTMSVEENVIHKHRPPKS
jgi:hypothetical protein